jgi:hypothetical protein
MYRLEIFLRELETKISSHSFLQPNVSSSSIGWHIEHILLTINKIVEATSTSDASNFKFIFKPIKYIVFLTGKIPRGKAKNPKVVEPEFFDESSLYSHLQKTKDVVLRLANIGKDKHFKHPYFGNLKLKDTIRFLEIHTDHHLKIINDIQKAASK